VNAFFSFVQRSKGRGRVEEGTSLVGSVQRDKRKEVAMLLASRRQRTLLTSAHRRLRLLTGLVEEQAPRLAGGRGGRHGGFCRTPACAVCCAFAARRRRWSCSSSGAAGSNNNNNSNGRGTGEGGSRLRPGYGLTGASAAASSPPLPRDPQWQLERLHQQQQQQQVRSIGMNGYTSLDTATASTTAPPDETHRDRSGRTRRWGKRRVRILFEQQQRRRGAGMIIPVSAIHIAQTIDLLPIMTTVFGRGTPVKKHLAGKYSIYIQLDDPAASISRSGQASTNVPGGEEEEEEQLARVSEERRRQQEPGVPRYVAIFRFGSVVFFNVSPKEAAALVRDIRRHATDPVLAGSERKENFGVLVGAAEAPDVKSDYVQVPDQLDMNGVKVIGHIMAQTVALDAYSDTVDALLANFAKINSTVTRTGSFTAGDKNFLFRTVAQNNSIFIDMISKIRIKDRSDTAWNLTKYQNIHYGMKEEFVSFLSFAQFLLLEAGPRPRI
jgi:uncharacterized Rmd1/YagE family protein